MARTMSKTHGRFKESSLVAASSVTVDPDPCPLGASFTVSVAGLGPGVVYSLKLIDRVGEQFPAATVAADDVGTLSAVLTPAWDGTNTVEVWQYAGGDAMVWEGPLASAVVEVTP